MGDIQDAAELHKLRQEKADLERRLADRGRELEGAVRELEEFAYSISHDLRAPLRAVTAFSRIVVEDHGPALPAEAQRLLGQVSTNAARMEQLIEELLRFSRLNRQPFNAREVDMTSLAAAAMADVRGPDEISGEGKRVVEVSLSTLPPAVGDSALLRQVWVNLLGNAWKFTRNSFPAVIETGCARQGGENAYFVRDNGAGFDLQYAKRLFGVFQRFHRADEFEGSGVGLAMVQRIITRHGGRIWAETAPGEGATFYFTLGS